MGSLKNAGIQKRMHEVPEYLRLQYRNQKMKDRMKLRFDPNLVLRVLRRKLARGHFCTDCDYNLRLPIFLHILSESVGGAVSEVEGYGVESRIRVV